MNYSKDLQLIFATNAGDKDAASQLFMKFMPLVQNLAQSCSGSEDDFIQDAFFSMLSAASKVDVSRIKDPSTYGFFQMYKSYLMNQSAKTRTAFNREAKKVTGASNAYLDENLHGTGSDEDSNFGTNGLLEDHATSRYNPENAFFQTQTPDKYVKFMKSCSVEEKTILKLRREGKTLKEIGQIIGLSTSKVQDKVVNLKRRASHVFEVFYQYA
jgi:RNA polymerase sigma factor (sigma-70 family)